MTHTPAALARLTLLAAAAALLAPRPAAADGPLFPFVLPWDDASRTVTDVNGWLDRDAPAGKLGPVVVRDGHLFTGPKRLRLLGVNLCFGANFPKHADAEKVAARMAKFGVNAVRFHHMDMQSAPGGIFAPDGKTLDPGQLDKLDYLFAQLKKNGVYADLNLHVSRTYPGRPTWEGMPAFHKGVDNFDPEMIRLQKVYARDLLTHVNPYTKTRYADEPAVAIVEINNENALVHEWFSGGLDAMPAAYADALNRRWNDWLKAKYRDDAALKKGWGAAEQPLGAEMLANGTFNRGLEHWNFELHEGAKGVASALLMGRETASARRFLLVQVDTPGKVGWHVQFGQAGLSLKSGTPYTMTFRARADAPRKIAVVASQAHEPWRPLWSADAALTGDWKSFQYTFSPSDSDDRARVSFSNLGDRAGRVEFSDVSLKPGGVLGLDQGESLGATRWFKKAEFDRRTPAAQRDWVRFLIDVETGYWTGMAAYLKDELKVKAPLVGTQMGWSPPTVQAKLDVIDSHAYWQHPDFPRRPWDPDDWSVKNLPMAGRPDGGTLPGLALSRVAGKPFLCTEYNHSAPNTYAAETLPLIFAFAAVQDWDGVFLFAYSHRHDDWDTGHFGSFFDVDQHPTKMATMPASAALFLRGDAPARAPTVVAADAEEVVDVLRRRGPWFGADAFGLSRGAALLGPVAQAFATPGAPLPLPGVERSRRPVGATVAWSWRSSKGQGAVTFDSPRSKVLVTGAVPGRFPLSGVTIAPGSNSSAWAVVTATALDGPDFHSPGRVLVTATGLAENTGMHWKDAKKESVGRDWGKRPSLVEGVPCAVTLPVAPDRLKAWALDERGGRKSPAALIGHTGETTLVLDPLLKTLWYEVVIGP